MQPIKFAPSNPIERSFGHAVRERVNAYFKERGISPKGNGIMVLQSLSLLSLYIVPFVLLLTVRMSGWVALPLTVVMGIGLAGIGMGVMHDAVHGSYSGKPWINRLFSASMYILGANILNWRIQHNMLHHTYTNIADYDQDIDSKGPIRLSEQAPFKPFHRWQHIHAFFFYGLMTLSKLFQDFPQLAEYNRRGITAQLGKKPGWEYVKMIAVKIFYAVVFIGLPVWLTPFTWWQILIGFLVMHWTAGCILSTVFQLAHVVEGVDQPVPDASGVIDADWAAHEIRTTANFAPNNAILNWYVGGLNFQVEHHLFPHICHVHYKEIYPIVRATAEEFGLPYHIKPSFRSALRSHIRRLRELGHPPVPAAA